MQGFVLVERGESGSTRSVAKKKTAQPSELSDSQSHLGQAVCLSPVCVYSFELFTPFPEVSY